MNADGPDKPDDDKPHDRVADLAARIADGTGIDWPSGSTADATHLDPATVEQLKAISAIANLNRAITEDGLPAGPARTWGTLAIVGRIGAGQFGEVFRAWDTRLQRQVALKLLRAPDSPEASANRAISEARNLARVRHPNVLTVYGAEQIGNRTGIWTELIEGETLELLLTKQGPLPESEATAIGIDLCRALAAVHEAGLVHRDVKAQNVMREVGGRIVLMDFGTGINVAGGIVRAGDLSGTPLYLAPELFAGAAPTPSTDLYALSVLLFHMLTGDYPVPGRTLNEVRANHEAGNRRRIRDVAPGVSEALAQVIDRDLSVKPDERYGSAGDLERALVAAVPAGALEQTRADSHPRSRRHLWSWLAAGAAAVTLLGIWTFAGANRLHGSPGPVCEDCFGLNVEGWGFAISPDGHLAVVADSVTGDLRIRDLTTGTIRPLGLPTALPAAAAVSEVRRHVGKPVFSPDSSHIAFLGFPASVNGPDEVWIVDLVGTLPKLVTIPGVSVDQIYDWSRDAKWLLVAVEGFGVPSFTPALPRGPEFQLAWISTDGAIKIVKNGWAKSTRRDEYSWFQELPSAARVSPDGRYIAYAGVSESEAGARMTIRHVYVMNADGGEQAGVVVTSADNQNPTWSPSGDRLYFTSDVSTSVDLWSVAMRDGRAIGTHRTERSDIGGVTELTIAPDGQVSYFRHLPPRGYLYIFETTSAEPTHGRPPMTTVAGSRPKWSEDGTILRFLRPRMDATDIRSSVAVMTLSMKDNHEETERVRKEEDNFLWYPPIRGLSVKQAYDFWNAVEEDRQSWVYGKGAPTTGYMADDEGRDIELVPAVVGPNAYAFRSDSTPEVRASRIVAIDVATGKVTPHCDLPNRVGGLSERNSVGLSLSRDGQTLAMALMAKGRATLSTVRLDTCEYRFVYGPYRTEGTTDRVAFTPDGRGILISQESGDGDRLTYQVLKVPADGGQPQVVMTLNGPDRETSFDLNVNGLLALYPNPAFAQPFATPGTAQFQLWRIDLNKR